MFDVSYAAAWELGRMLMLSEKDLARALFNWKRSRRHELHRAEEAIVFPHLPFNQGAQLPADMPENLARWLDGLRLLEHVPFNYLVPDERMLPSESIRFFQVDELWLEAILDGVFSIGRVPYKAPYKPHKPAHPNLSGFLLRSEVVSGWPDLIVDAYDQSPDGDEDLSGNRLPLLRMARVSSNIMLCLFDGLIKTVDIHLRPEAFHYGLVSCKYKDLRDIDGTEAENKQGNPGTGGLPPQAGRGSPRSYQDTQQVCQGGERRYEGTRAACFRGAVSKETLALLAQQCGSGPTDDRWCGEGALRLHRRGLIDSCYCQEAAFYQEEGFEMTCSTIDIFRK